MEIVDRCLDRQRGTLIGLAVGDTLGSAVEFQPPGTFEPVTGYRAGGPHGLGPGEWTDDTSMALALADSIASVGWDLDDQARRYVDWCQKGKYSVNGRCFDIGVTTRGSLVRFLEIENARKTINEILQSAANQFSSGIRIVREYIDMTDGTPTVHGQHFFTIERYITSPARREVMIKQPTEN